MCCELRYCIVATELNEMSLSVRDGFIRFCTYQELVLVRLLLFVKIFFTKLAIKKGERPFK